MGPSPRDPYSPLRPMPCPALNACALPLSRNPHVRRSDVARLRRSARDAQVVNNYSPLRAAIVAGNLHSLLTATVEVSFPSWAILILT
jgi:hypothetical protein